MGVFVGVGVDCVDPFLHGSVRDALSFHDFAIAKGEHLNQNGVAHIAIHVDVLSSYPSTLVRGQEYHHRSNVVITITHPAPRRYPKSDPKHNPETLAADSP